jgi:hypothetical protein
LAGRVCPPGSFQEEAGHLPHGALGAALSQLESICQYYLQKSQMRVNRERKRTRKRKDRKGVKLQGKGLILGSEFKFPFLHSAAG